MKNERTVLTLFGLAISMLLVACVPTPTPTPTPTPKPTPVVVPPPALEVELSKANIILTEVPGKRDLVVQWLNSDQQYQQMAQSCLTVLVGKKVIKPVPLDVIVCKYRMLSGVPCDGYLFPDKYNDTEKAKTAIFTESCINC